MDELFLYPKRRGKVNVAVCYPNSYSVAISSLAFNKILGLFLEADFNVCRFFYEKGKTINIDKLFTLNKSHIIAFTISFEPDALHVLSMLIENNISVDKNKREILIIGGGIFSTINDRFLSNVFDYVFKGEIETVQNKLINILIDHNNKEETVSELEKEIGNNIYITDPFDNPAHSVVISSTSSFENTFLIEISRGCKYSCPYCLVTSFYRSFRPVPLEILLEKIDFGLKYSAKIGLVSALSNAHPQIIEIADYILKKGGTPLFSSLRLELINDDFLKILTQTGQKTITLGIESANEEIRKKLGKPFTNDFINDFITRALHYGIRSFKLYFMAGLPGEEKGDEAIINLCKNIRKIFLPYAKEHGIMPILTIDVSLFVPKPLTKWENTKMESKKFYIEYIKTLKRWLPPLGIDIRSDDIYFSEAQYVLGSGGQDLCLDICNALKNNSPIKRVIRNNLY